MNEIVANALELVQDAFGNYLCQKLIEHCRETQRLAVIQKVAPDLVAISLNMHGTRAVQKMVETIVHPPEIELVVNALKSSVVTLIKVLTCPLPYAVPYHIITWSAVVLGFEWESCYSALFTSSFVER